MEYLIVCTIALLASGLTLFSGFGLGTLLLPAFILFFPPDVAVGMTAIVHFLNNIFKLVLLGKHADGKVVLRFGVPAIVSALVGAALLVYVTDLPAVGQIEILGWTFFVMPVKLLIALLMIVFAVVEIVPVFEQMQIDPRYLPLGGVLSGFFGGISGHQGALRSAFLVRAGLSKESFIATGVVIACMIDVTRLSVYAEHISSAGLGENAALLIAATLSAFTGAFVGNRLVKKVTMAGIQRTVSVLLILIAVALALGVV